MAARAPRNNRNNASPRVEAAGSAAAAGRAGEARSAAAPRASRRRGPPGDRWRSPAGHRGVAAQRAGARPHTNQGRHVRGEATPRLTWAARWRVPAGGAGRGAGRRRAGRCRSPREPGPGAGPPPRILVPLYNGGARLWPTSGKKTHARCPHTESCAGVMSPSPRRRG